MDRRAFLVAVALVAAASGLLLVFSSSKPRWLKTCSSLTCGENRPLKCPGLCLCVEGSLCDGVADCPSKNGAPVDEEPGMCRNLKFLALAIPNFKCQSGEVKCADETQCIATWKQCDGKKDCLDESDEKPSLCADYDCAATNRAQCPGRQGCMASVCRVCDQVKDCADGSDELPESCDLLQNIRCARPSPIP